MSNLNGGMPKKVKITRLDSEIIEKEDLIHLNLVDVKSRRHGILFLLGNIQYIYAYTPCEDREYVGEIELIDKRFFNTEEEHADNQVTTYKGMIKFIEIIESSNGYVLSEIFKIDTVDVGYWIEHDFKRVVVNLWEYFDVHNIIIDEFENVIDPDPLQ